MSRTEPLPDDILSVRSNRVVIDDEKLSIHLLFNC